MSVIIAALLAALLLAISSAPSAWATDSTSFTFFLHDGIGSGAYDLTAPVLTAPLGSLFGSLVVFDESITSQPDANSLEVGRGRGMYLSDANDNMGRAIDFIWTAQFNAASGYGSGTTMSFAGFDRTTDQTREISVVGGTGTFRYARGYAIITTTSLSPSGLSAVLNITAYVNYGS